MTGFKVEVAWDKVTWTDETAYVRPRISALSARYGRDQITALAPTVSGEASLVLDNATRRFSPRNTASPLYGKLKPARPVRIYRELGGTTTTVFVGHTADTPINPETDAQTVTLSLVDSLADFRSDEITTPLCSGIRTGQAIGFILDACDWPANLRDLDTGATVIPWWWEDGTNAFEALEKVVRSEGPPAMLFMGADGSVIFRDRHHRLLQAASITSQQTWVDTAGTFTDAAAGYEENFNAGIGAWHGPATVAHNTASPIEGAGQMRWTFTWPSSGLWFSRLDNGPITATNRTANGLAFRIKARLAAGGPAGVKARLEIYADGADRPGPFVDLMPGQVVDLPAQFDATYVDSMQHWSIQVQRDESTAVQTVIDFDLLQQGTITGVLPSQVMNKPFTYDEAWDHLINYGATDVAERHAGQVQQIWTSDATISLGINETKLITVSGTDPFYNARVPIEGLDYTLTAGIVTASLFRTSGGSTTIKLTAEGTATVVTGLQLRAQPVSVANTVQVSASDELSRADYGRKSFPGDLPWCGAGDADAVLRTAVALRSQPLPIVTARMLVGTNTARASLLGRDLGDRVTIIEAETVTNRPFLIEAISHDATSVFDHAITFGLEAAPVHVTPAIRLNVSGLLGAAYLTSPFVDPENLIILDSNVSGHRLGEGVLAA